MAGPSTAIDTAAPVPVPESGAESSTPAITEGDSATTETELETETEVEEDLGPVGVNLPNVTKPSSTIIPKHYRHQPQSSIASSISSHVGSIHQKKKSLSQHDLLNKYFRRDVVVFRNLDLLRSVNHNLYIRRPTG